MADGRIEIDTKIQNDNLKKDLKEMDKAVKNEFRQLKAEFRLMENSFKLAEMKALLPFKKQMFDTEMEMRKMQNELRITSLKAMLPFKKDMINTEKEFLKLGMSMGKYQGTNKEFMKTVEELGATQKKARDNMIKNDKMIGVSIMQQAAAMLNMTSQAKRISEGYDRMKNPLLSVNKAGLKFADTLQETAHRGNAAVLALKRLGPNANMKQLQDEMMKITQGQMRFQQVAMASAVTTGVVFALMNKMAMETDKQYKTAFENMKKNVVKALQPMVQVFASAMTHVYNMVSSLAQMIQKFNQAHPVMAKFISAVLLLVPALTLLLAPLAVGIGLLDGMLAAFSSVFILIEPLVTGLAAMSATVWLVAGAIAGAVIAFGYFYKTSEKFRNTINTGASDIGKFGKNILNLGRYFLEVASTGKVANDMVSRLPKAWQKAVQEIGQHLANLRKAVTDAFNGDFSEIEKIFSNIIPSIIGFLVGGIPGLIISASRFIPAISQGIESNADQLTQTIQKVMNNVSNWLINDLPKYIQIGIDIINGIVQGFVKNIPIFVNALTNIINMIVPLIIQLIPSLLNAGIMIIGAIISGINSMLSSLIDAFTKIFPAIITALATAFPLLLQSGMQIMQAIINGISQNLPLILSMATQLLSLFLNTITQLLPQIVTMGLNLVIQLINGIVQMIPALLPVAIRIINEIINVLSNNLPLFISFGIQIITSILQAITNMLPLLAAAAVTIIKHLTQTLIANLPQIINAGVGMITALINGFVQALPSIIQAVVNLITIIIKALSDNLPLIINAGIQVMGALIQGIIQVMPLLFSAAGQIIGIILQSIGSNLPKILDLGLQLITSLLTGIGQAFPQLRGLMNVLKSILTFVFPLVKGIIMSTWGAIVNVIQGSLKVINGIVGIFSNLFKGNWKGVWNSVKELASGAVQAIWGLLNLWFVGKFLKPLKTFGTTAKTVMSKGWSLIKDAVANSIKSMKTFAENSFKSLKKNLASTTSSAKTSISNIWNSLKNNVFKSASNIRSDVSKEFSNMKKNASNSAHNIKTDVSKGFSDMRSSVGTSMGRVYTAIKNQWGKAKKFLTSINLKSAGKNIIQGLINGLKALNPATTIANVAHSLVKKFKSVLGIHSPSRVFHSMGGYILQGLVNGLSAHNLKDFGESVLKDFGGGILKGWGSVKGFFKGLLGGGSGNTTGWLTAALGLTGTPITWLSGLQKLVKAESGGNPKAVNPTTVMGQHAQGLLQMLPSTFKAYALKGRTSIMNPIDNAAAAIEYIKSRYGSVYNTPLFKGGKYKGYAKGTDYAPGGISLVGEKGFEIADIPGIGAMLVGLKGAQLINLPRGSKVYTHNESEKMLKGTSTKPNALQGFINKFKGATPNIKNVAPVQNISNSSTIVNNGNNNSGESNVYVQPTQVAVQLDSKQIAQAVIKWQQKQDKIRNVSKGMKGALS